MRIWFTETRIISVKDNDALLLFIVLSLACFAILFGRSCLSISRYVKRATSFISVTRSFDFSLGWTFLNNTKAIDVLFLDVLIGHKVSSLSYWIGLEVYAKHAYPNKKLN